MHALINLFCHDFVELFAENGFHCGKYPVLLLYFSHGKGVPWLKLTYVGQFVYISSAMTMHCPHPVMMVSLVMAFS